MLNSLAELKRKSTWLLIIYKATAHLLSQEDPPDYICTLQQALLQSWFSLKKTIRWGETSSSPQGSPWAEHLQFYRSTCVPDISPTQLCLSEVPLYPDGKNCGL